MLRRSRLFALVALSAGLVLPVTAAAQSSEPSPLAGTSWAVSQIGGADATGPTLVFSDDVAGGFAGCNNYSASYTVEGPSLTFGPTATTLKLCDEPASTLESSYLAALATIVTYAIDGETLTLTDAADAPALVFAAATPTSLEGDWNVTGYNNGQEAVVSVLVGTQPTVTFAPDGTVSGHGGCNGFGGGYSTDGSTIAVGPLFSTQIACEEDISTQEAQLLAALDLAGTWSISGDMLELRGADDTIQVTLQAAP